MSVRWRHAALLWVLWSAIALAFGLQALVVQKAIFGARIEWWRPFLINLLGYQFWWLLTPLVLEVGRRFPLEARGRSLLVHALAALAVPVLYLTLCHVFVFQWLRSEAYRPMTSAAQFALTVAGNLHLEVLTYVAIVGIQAGLRILRQRQEDQLRAARLETRLAEARLLALRMQLQPHFLFNALNGVSALIHEDPEAADSLLARLADFLRLGLDTSGRNEVPLSEELEFLRLYLEIEAIRFEDRLKVTIEVPRELLSTRVPCLILQPLVENAVRHGIARREEPGRIQVRAQRANGRLRLVVRNDGPALADGTRDGIGIGNCRARLEQLYGTEARLRLDDDPGGGVVAELTLPIQADPEPVAESPA
jgi:sensor histidine kinase YesM